MMKQNKNLLLEQKKKSPLFHYVVNTNALFGDFLKLDKHRPNFFVVCVLLGMLKKTPQTNADGKRATEKKYYFFFYEYRQKSVENLIEQDNILSVYFGKASRKE